MNKPFKIAFVSGKGGAGKTMFACSFAYVLKEKGKSVLLMDLDTEEPNSYLFFEGEEEKKEITRPLPDVQMDKCIHCNICSDACGFNAIAILPSSSMVFPDLCHSCMGCAKLCPTDAIAEKPHTTGFLYRRSAEIPLIYGKLQLGEASSIPLMEEIEKALSEYDVDIAVIDGPPGNACPAVETINYADYIIFVVDATPAGISDIQNTIEVAYQLNKKGKIILNRYEENDVTKKFEKDIKEKYGYEVIYKQSFDRKIAELYAHKTIPVKQKEELFENIYKIYKQVEENA